MSDIKINMNVRTARILQEEVHDHNGMISFTNKDGMEQVLQVPMAPTPDDMERTRQLALGARALKLILNTYLHGERNGDIEKVDALIKELCAGGEGEADEDQG